MPTFADTTKQKMPFSTKVTRSFRYARRSTNTVIGSGQAAPWNKHTDMFLWAFNTAIEVQLDVEVLGEPRMYKTVWVKYCLDPGMFGWSTGWALDCVVGVMVGPRTVWL